MAREGIRALRAFVASTLVIVAALVGMPAMALATEGDAAALGSVTVASGRLGIGGSGALFDPAVSPFDASEMVAGTDISWFTSRNNYQIEDDGAGKVALAVTDFIYDSPSVAAMRSDTMLSAGDVVRTRAYYEGGSADGGATYDIVAAPLVASAVTVVQGSAASALAPWLAAATTDTGAFVDDGGSHIKLDNGLWAVLRVEDDTVNVRQFGAKGDGRTDGTTQTANANAANATDDAGRLAAVMAYAEANPGTTVRFPAGTYCVSHGIEVPAHTTLTGAYTLTTDTPAVAVIAEGKSATLGMYAGGIMHAKPENQEGSIELLATITPLDPTTHSTSLVSLGSSDGVSIDHLVIDAGRSIQEVVDALPDYAINNYDWADPTMPYRGYFTALTFGGNKGVRVADCIVRNNVSMGCQFNGGEDVTFERCDFLSVDVGIQEQGANPVRDVYIRDCYFEGHDWSEPVAFGPTYTGDATGIWIERNTMRDIKYAHAILLGERTQAYVDHTTFKDVHINDNVAYGMATFVGVSLADGLKMRDNRGYDAGQSYLYSCANVEIDGLEMHGCVQHGLLVGQECENVSIKGLVVEDYDKGGNGAPGIDLSGTATNVSLAGTVTSARAGRGPGLNLSGSGYDLSGLQFYLDGANYFDVMVHEGGVGNTLHVGAGVAEGLGIPEGAYRVPRVYVAEAVARANDFAFDYTWPKRDRGSAVNADAAEQFSGMRATGEGTYETVTTLPVGHGRYYGTVAIHAWDGAEDGEGNLTISYMEPAQDGFARTLSLVTAGDMHLVNGNPSRSGAIVWAGERTLAANGETPYTLTLTCQDGVWYEQGEGARDNAFASLATLREATGLAAGEVVRTHAYREGSGKGGARYLVCDAATAARLVNRETSELADDGGRLIRLAGTQGLWAVLAGVEVDAYAFGAYGDGEHDDADVLRALLDSGLERVRLSEGTYLVGTPLVATAAISVEGAGTGKSKVVASSVLAASTGATLLTVRDVEGFSISDVGLVGTSTGIGAQEASANALDLLRVDACAQTQVRGCAFGPATGDGIVMRGSARTTVSDCAISGVATGIHVSEAADGADDVVTLTKNAISDVAADGIAIMADGSAYQGRVVISGNTISGAPAGAGILLARANRYELVEIGSNAVSSCYVGIRAGGIVGTLDATDANPRRVTSNIVRDATYGIIFERSSGTALILNEVYDVKRTGLYLDTLADCRTIWGWVTRYGLDADGSDDGLSDGCAIECVGPATNVRLGGWVNGNHRLADFAATKGRTACRVDGTGWDLSGLTFFCTMQEEDGRPTVTLAAGAEDNVFHTQYDAIVLDASGKETNTLDKATEDVRLIVWRDRAEPKRIQAVSDPTAPRVDRIADERTYANVADMRADGSLAPGDIATTLAYHAGDSAAGAGVYDIVAADGIEYANASKKPDSGRYVTLENGLVAVLRTPDGVVDLYQYGAHGDGATDDTARVQAAFESGCPTVRVSAGTYVCGGAHIPSGTSVVGVGRDACAFVSPLGEGGHGVAGPLGVASGAHDVALKNVTVDGRRDVYAKTGVSRDADAPTLAGDAAHFVYDDAGAGNYTLFGWLGGAVNVAVEGCAFKSNNSEAVKFVGGENITFTDCEFLDVDCGIITQGVGEEANVTDLTVDGCTFDGHWFSEPISMFAEGARYEKLTFTNNTFRDKPAGSAILLYADNGERQNSFHDVTIVGNTMRRCSGGLALYAVDGATITSNDLGGSTARLYGCSNMALDGLTFKDCPQLALLLRDCANVRVAGLDVDGFGISSSAFPAISIGDAAGGQNTGCSVAGTVRGSAAPDGSWRSAVNATAGGVDLSGLTFAMGANTHALFVNHGVTGLTYHTSQDVSVYDGSGTLANDIVVEHAVVLSGGATLDNWNRTHNTTYELSWITYADESLSQMAACQDGFVRTLTVAAVNSDAHLASDASGASGSIVWARERTIAKGTSETVTLTCQDGVWRELGKGTFDASDTSPVITTVDDLVAFRNAVNDGATFEGTTVTLAASLDLADAGAWTPIGTDATHLFKGSFDGGGNTISGLAVMSMENNAGLFGYVGGVATIKDLHVAGSVSGKGCVGGVAGATYGMLTGCTFAGTVTGTASGVGGVAGMSYGTLSGCSFAGTVTGDTTNVGGIVGQGGGAVTACRVVAPGSAAVVSVGVVTTSSLAASTVTGASAVGGIRGANSSGIIAGCAFDGAVYATASTEKSGVGGIVGTTARSDAVSVQDCVTAATATVTGPKGVGGIVGTNVQGTVYACRNAATVASADATTGAAYVGGVVGSNYPLSGVLSKVGIAVVSQCENVGTVISNGTYVGGILGYDHAGSVLDCRNLGSVTAAHTVGGIAGMVGNSYSSYARIERNYSEGVVSATAGSNLGGVLGIFSNFDDTKVNHNYYLTLTCTYNGKDSGVTGLDYPGKAEALSAERAADVATFTNPTTSPTVAGAAWDFGDVWVMDATGRPALRVFAPAHTHELRAVAAVEPTCTEAGNVAYWMCDGCGAWFADAEGATEITAANTVVAALGHAWGDGTITTNPTCTDKGVKTFMCTRCGETRISEIGVDPNAHDWDAPTFEWTGDGMAVPSVIATYVCGHDGKHTGAVVASVTEDATAHVEPTQTSAGSATYVAAVAAEASLDGKEHRETRVYELPKLDAIRVRVSGITAKGKAYDGTTAAELDLSGATLTAAGGGEVAGDVSVTATGAFADATAGEGKEVRITGLALAGADADGYALAEAGQQATATAAIEPRVAGIEWGDAAFTYDGGAHAPFATATNLVVGDECAVTVGVAPAGDVALSDGAAVGAGAYTATATALSNPNYRLPGDVIRAFTIERAHLTVTANDATVTYGEAAAGAGVTYDGLVERDRAGLLPAPGVVTGAVSYSFGSYALGAKAGSMFRIAPSGLATDNYDITFADGTLTVAPRVAQLAWEGEAFVYDGAPRSVAATVANRVGTDDVAVVLEGASATDVGTYTATAVALSGADAASYVLPEDAARAHVWAIARADDEPTPALPAGTATNVTAGRALGNWGEADLASGGTELASAVGVASGKWAEVWVVATDDISDVNRAAVVRAAGAYTVVHAFDARLFKSVAGAVSELHELAAPVEVTVGLPAGVPAVGPGMVRSWALVRVHGGEAALLPAAYDAATSRLTFATDRFSTYAVAYRDVPAAGSVGTAAAVDANESGASAGAAAPAPSGAAPAPSRGPLAQTGDPHDRRRATGLALAGATALLAGLVLGDRRRGARG